MGKHDLGVDFICIIHGVQVCFNFVIHSDLSIPSRPSAKKQTKTERSTGRTIITGTGWKLSQRLWTSCPYTQNTTLWHQCLPAPSLSSGMVSCPSTQFAPCSSAISDGTGPDTLSFLNKPTHEHTGAPFSSLSLFSFLAMRQVFSPFFLFPHFASEDSSL